MGHTIYQSADVGGVSVFYREAGPPDARDVPDAEVHLLDAGHFALDEQPDRVAELTRQFLRPLVPLSKSLERRSSHAS
jgi:pimeloyl-ACP methyl ester carboxylesterase